MRKNYTQENVPVSHKSHYEQTWTAQDFGEHDKEFKDMLIEYRELRRLNGDDPLLARRQWLQKNKALKVKGYDIVVNPEKYPMMSAMFDKFTEWMSFQEKPNPAEVESLEKMKEQITDEININDIPI
jgi:hypothetical protein